MSDREECVCELCELELWKDEHSRIPSETTYATATLSLLDIARYQVTKRHGKGTADNPVHGGISHHTLNYSEI